MQEGFYRDGLFDDAHLFCALHGPYNILTLCLSKNLTFIRQDNVRDTKTEYNLVVGDTEME